MNNILSIEDARLSRIAEEEPISYVDPKYKHLGSKGPPADFYDRPIKKMTLKDAMDLELGKVSGNEFFMRRMFDIHPDILTRPGRLDHVRKIAKMLGADAEASLPRLIAENERQLREKNREIDATLLNPSAAMLGALMVFQKDIVRPGPVKAGERKTTRRGFLANLTAAIVGMTALCMPIEAVAQVCPGAGGSVFGGYVTPQMFCCVGNGSTDDTANLILCFQANKPVLLVGKFLTTGPININTIDTTPTSTQPNGIHIIGAGGLLSQIIMNNTSCGITINHTGPFAVVWPTLTPGVGLASKMMFKDFSIVPAVANISGYCLTLMLTPIPYGTSSTSTAIGTGSKTFTTSSSFGIANGTSVLVYSAGTPTARMQGIVTSDTGTSLVLTVNQTAGSGTHTDWIVAATFAGLGVPTFKIDGVDISPANSSFYSNGGILLQDMRNGQLVNCTVSGFWGNSTGNGISWWSSWFWSAPIDLHLDNCIIYWWVSGINCIPCANGVSGQANDWQGVYLRGTTILTQTCVLAQTIDLFAGSLYVADSNTAFSDSGVSAPNIAQLFAHDTFYLGSTSFGNVGASIVGISNQQTGGFMGSVIRDNSMYFAGVTGIATRVGILWTNTASSCGGNIVISATTAASPSC